MISRAAHLRIKCFVESTHTKKVHEIIKLERKFDDLNRYDAKIRFICRFKRNHSSIAP